VSAPAAARVGRDGALTLRFERRGRSTVLAASRSVLPLQVLAPLALGDPAAVVSVLNPTGGVLGGDRLAIDVEVGPGADACITTPSATRVYRADGRAAEQRVRLALAAGASLEWVPDHTIPFPGAALRQRIEAEVADGAALILVDAWAAGRIARGEAWRFARVDSTISVGDGKGPIVLDRFALPAGTAGESLGLAEGHPYFASVVVVADGGLDRLAGGLARPAIAGASLGAARLARRGLLVRCLAASAPALTNALDAVWALARRHVLARPPLALRKG
jgi:urease accessory protein